VNSRLPRLFANARMYAVTPRVEALWQGLLEHVFADAGLAFAYLPYPAPQPLEDLWSRPDLGCVFMCGYPIALRMADVRPVAAPILSLPWAQGKPLYRSDLIVRSDAPFRTLDETFGGVSGWTVEHSHSGFNAWRHHLLHHRSAERPALYGRMRGHLVTARRILDSVREGQIDIGPLDAYWHALIARHAPDLVAGISVLDHTALAPIPSFVVGPQLGGEETERLRLAFATASSQAWFDDFAGDLLISGFAPVQQADFAETLRWDRDAIAAGYPQPA
jgi:ABC-type phosphate/phosphonate transport system substrate-binding protein